VLVRTVLAAHDHATGVNNLGRWSGQLIAGTESDRQSVPPPWPSSPTAAQLGHGTTPYCIISTGLLLLFGVNGMSVIRTS
jgi:hypothetical protein